MRRAIALGAFDGLHTAHMAVLKAAVRQEGLRPAVLLFDNHPLQALTGCAPPRLLTEEDRDGILRGMGLEILYTQFDEIMDMPPQTFFKEILLGRHNAGALSCGYDYSFGAGALGRVESLRQMCAAHGVQLQATPEIDYRGAPVSSTRIRQALRDGRPEDAAAMLGRPFGYTFPVEEGGRIGRMMGFPTLNQTFPQRFAVPRHGVYASQVFIENKWRPSVTNAGVAPTRRSGDESGCLPQARSETHVLNYTGDLYGRRVPVRLLRFLRPEQKFDNLERLKAQIALDIMNAQKEA